VNYISSNGKIVTAAEPVIAATNQGYRYGDGLFETLKMINGKIQLEELHFERLFLGMHLLEYRIPKHFSVASLKEEIIRLATKNKCEELSRIRVSVSRGNGGIHDGDEQLQCLIENWKLENDGLDLNSNGLVVGMYRDAVKSIDRFSNLKSANYLPYMMASRFATSQQWNEALLLNSDGNIVDSSIANIFLIKNGKLITPSLQQGPVAGVMRSNVITECSRAGLIVEETIVKPEDLLNADELFLTNSIRGIRWIANFMGKSYPKTETEKIHRMIFKRN
jgi:branched-chain amino acid aminotransferase